MGRVSSIAKRLDMSDSKTQRFTNETVLITDGSSGIGLAAARAFIQEGASVTVVGLKRIQLLTPS
jgi:NADP-dependent 3-hydroxy acid dehydrogenase YdfG